uniref:PHD-type domain-containing protein n=1 Tax=Amphimedon queenslandica TaxID=400682 RepID=A0A1X7VSN4_AMPQE
TESSPKKTCKKRTFSNKDVGVSSSTSGSTSNKRCTKAYCFCKKELPGYMTACDNPSCAIEWFHYKCVNITQAPAGNWYCPKC